MISKELLSKVLQEDIVEVMGVEENLLKYKVKRYGTWNGHYDIYDWIETINIYELAYKCKEWANTRGLLYTVFCYDKERGALYGQ